MDNFMTRKRALRTGIGIFTGKLRGFFTSVLKPECTERSVKCRFLPFRHRRLSVHIQQILTLAEVYQNF